jgi:neutral ceramidase
MMTYTMRDDLLCGAAQADITLHVGTPMGGFANRASACTGVLDPLSARALFLKQGNSACLLITLDALAINAEWASLLHAEAARACGDITPAEVRVICSHTHSGASLSDMFGESETKAVYFEYVIKAVRDVAARASTMRTSCVLRAGYTEYPIGKNRRMRPGHAQVTALERIQGEQIDHTLTAVRLDNAISGVPLATLFHMACHPVCLGPENVLASGDYAGIAAHHIEQHTGAPALFLNGAAGNVTPIIGRGSSYAATQALGQAVGNQVLNATYAEQSCEVRITPRRLVALPLGCIMRNAFDIEHASDRLRALDTGFMGWAEVVNRWSERMKALLMQGALKESVDIPFSAVQIGDMRFVFIGAEVFNEYQLWAPHNTRIVSYTDGESCYVPTAAALAGGGYEVTTSPVFYGLPCAPSADAERVLRKEIGD